MLVNFRQSNFVLTRLSVKSLKLNEKTMMITVLTIFIFSVTLIIIKDCCDYKSL